MIDRVDTDLRGNRLCGILPVAGQHDQLLDADFAELPECRSGARLHDIRNDDMSHITAAVCGVYHGSVLLDRGEINVFALKQLFVAEKQLSAVQHTLEPVSGRLMHLAETRAVNFTAVGL